MKTLLIPASVLPIAAQPKARGQVAKGLIVLTGLVLSLATCAPVSVEGPKVEGPKVEAPERDLASYVDEMGKVLVADLGRKKSWRVAILDVIGIDGNVSEFDRYVVNRLTESLVNTNTIRLVERQRVKAILNELKLNLTDVVDSDKAQEIGKLLGAEGLILGQRTDLGKKVDVTLRLIETETGLIIAAKGFLISRTRDIERLLQRRIRTVGVGRRPPLEVRMSLAGQRRVDGGQYMEIPFTEGSTLRSKDWFQVHFQTNADAYVYMILFEAGGRAQLLFPLDPTRLNQKLRGWVWHVIPGRDRWYFLDERVGTETLYLLASYEPIRELNVLLRALESAGKGQMVAAEARKSVIISRRIQKQISQFQKGIVQRSVYTARLKQRGVGEAVSLIRQRGVGGVVQGNAKSVKLSDGRVIQNATEIIRGYNKLVRRISYRHVPKKN